MLCDHCGIIYREMPGIQGLSATFGVSFLPLAYFPQYSAFQKHLKKTSALLPLQTMSLVFSCLRLGTPRHRLFGCTLHTGDLGSALNVCERVRALELGLSFRDVWWKGVVPHIDLSLKGGHSGLLTCCKANLLTLGCSEGKMPFLLQGIKQGVQVASG